MEWMVKSWLTACCLPDASCEDLVPWACLGRGGRPTSPPAPFDAITCVPEIACRREIGTPGVPGSERVKGACSRTAFACCLRDGTCQESTTRACRRDNGEFHNGELCASVTCSP